MFGFVRRRSRAPKDQLSAEALRSGEAHPRSQRARGVMLPFRQTQFAANLVDVSFAFAQRIVRRDRIAQLPDAVREFVQENHACVESF